MPVTPLFEFADKIHITVKRGGNEISYLLHKSCVFMAMDARWLSDPDGQSQTATFLMGCQEYLEPTGPRGYGFLVIDFDARSIESFQSYKDVSTILIDEFGYHGGATPIWMDWKAVVNDAFSNGNVTEVFYAPQNPGKQVIVKLPALEQGRQNLALRFASHNKPIGYGTLGVGFKQHGWTVTHVPVPVNVVARRTISQKMLARLRELAITIAPPLQWAEFVKFY